MTTTTPTKKVLIKVELLIDQTLLDVPRKAGDVVTLEEHLGLWLQSNGYAKPVAPKTADKK